MEQFCFNQGAVYRPAMEIRETAGVGRSDQPDTAPPSLNHSKAIRFCGDFIQRDPYGSHGSENDIDPFGLVLHRQNIRHFTGLKTGLSVDSRKDLTPLINHSNGSGLFSG